MRLGMQGIGGQRSEREIPRAAVEGGEDNFCERKVPLLWLLPDSFQLWCQMRSLKKSQQKPSQLENHRAKCLPTWTSRVYKWAHLLFPIPLFRLFNCARHDSDKRADSNTSRTFRTVGFRVVAPRCPGNVEMCP